MKRNTTLAMVIGGAAALCLVPAMSESVSAQTLGASWTYQYDAVGDGSGGSGYDIKGMAMMSKGDRLFVALTGGTPLAGVKENGVTNGTVSWGDLFFNFSGKKFNDAAAAGQLFGVRFAASNDSAVGLGVYSGVKTTSVAGQNIGYSSLESYYNAGFDKANTQGTAISTKAGAYDYYGKGAIQNSIASGTKVGDIAMLMGGDLSSLGLNFGNNAGTNTFGFSFDKNAIGSGNFLASLFLECGNDGMAFNATAAPEPTTMAGAAIAGSAFAAFKRRRRKQNSAA
ncbi:MAG: XDD3 domain-containing surface protein [Leptolyngbyaceae cyanobacterium bins.302]|nr:XDD3 domain-containing surface protein [Leptolyngbyaceae cyanobacterium bins.302]